MLSTIAFFANLFNKFSQSNGEEGNPRPNAKPVFLPQKPDDFEPALVHLVENTTDRTKNVGFCETKLFLSITKVHTLQDLPLTYQVTYNCSFDHVISLLKKKLNFKLDHNIKLYIEKTTNFGESRCKIAEFADIYQDIGCEKHIIKILTVTRSNSVCRNNFDAGITQRIELCLADYPEFFAHFARLEPVQIE